MTRKELTQEMRAISEMMGKTKNCTKTEWERTNKKQYAEYKAEYDHLRAEYDRKYGRTAAVPRETKQAASGDCSRRFTETEKSIL